MSLIRKIDDHREPPGLERSILNKIPVCLAGGTVVPLLMMLFGRWLPTAESAMAAAKNAQIIQFIAYGMIFTVWTAALTVAIGCLVVIVMKGPTYEADSYYMEEPERSDEADWPR